MMTYFPMYELRDELLRNVHEQYHILIIPFAPKHSKLSPSETEVDRCSPRDCEPLDLCPQGVWI